MAFASIDELDSALAQASYLADRGLATALYLSLKLEKPLLLEGEAGVGKTEAAKAIAIAVGARLIRLQCYEGLDIAHAVYEWNYARQLLHIRAAQAGTVDEAELFGPEFLIRRPVLEAIESEERVLLLIDEIDRADEEFEAFLLEVLSDFQVTVAELGTITAEQRPYVILTSNRTRELHDALKRRCLYHWIGHPSVEREIEIVELRVPGVPERLAEQAAGSPRSCARSTCRSRPGSPRRSTGCGADGPRPAGARRRERPGDARLPAQVPRGPARDSRRALAGLVAQPSVAERPHAVVRHVVIFGRVLREGGLEVGPHRVADALRALDAVDLARQEDVYWTLRQTLVSRRDDLEPSTARSRPGSCASRPLPELGARAAPPRGERRKGGAPGPGPELDGGETSVGAWSADELLRTRDFAAMTPEEFARAPRLIRQIALARPLRARTACAPTAAAAHSTCAARAWLARDGRRPGERAYRSRATAPRKLVLILDISGSMEAYARALLLYLHAARGSGRGVETFAFGTRLTRLTPRARPAHPEAAFEAAAGASWTGPAAPASATRSRRTTTSGAAGR